MARSPKSAVSDRSPLHPSALRLNSVRPGVRFIQFNKDLGIMETGTFVSTPYVANWGSDLEHTLVVRVLRSDGSTQERALVDLGITPDVGKWWNRVNYTIHLKKRHLLPKPTGRSRSFMDMYADYLDSDRLDDDGLGPLDDLD